MTTSTKTPLETLAERHVRALFHWAKLVREDRVYARGKLNQRDPSIARTI